MRLGFTRIIAGDLEVEPHGCLFLCDWGGAGVHLVRPIMGPTSIRLQALARAEGPLQEVVRLTFV